MPLTQIGDAHNEPLHHNQPFFPGCSFLYALGWKSESSYHFQPRRSMEFSTMVVQLSGYEILTHTWMDVGIPIFDLFKPQMFWSPNFQPFVNPAYLQHFFNVHVQMVVSSQEHRSDCHGRVRCIGSSPVGSLLCSHSGLRKGWGRLEIPTIFWAPVWIIAL